MPDGRKSDRIEGNAPGGPFGAHKSTASSALTRADSRRAARRLKTTFCIASTWASNVSGTRTVLVELSINAGPENS